MDKLERVARALCAVEGRDPDEVSWTGGFNAGGSTDFRGAGPEMRPNWHSYRDDARRFVAAFEAMRAAELEPMADAVPEGTITSDG